MTQKDVIDNFIELEILEPNFEAWEVKFSLGEHSMKYKCFMALLKAFSIDNIFDFVSGRFTRNRNIADYKDFYDDARKKMLENSNPPPELLNTYPHLDYSSPDAIQFYFELLLQYKYKFVSYTKNHTWSFCEIHPSYYYPIHLIEDHKTNGQIKEIDRALETIIYPKIIDIPISQLVRDYNFPSGDILISFSGFNQNLGYFKEMILKADSLVCLQDLLNLIFKCFLTDDVNQYSYGVQWVIFNRTRNAIISKSNQIDKRKLEEVGINKNDELIVTKL